MATFGDLKKTVIRMLGDEVGAGTPVGGADYPADLLQDAIHAALDGILPWYWKRKQDTIAGEVISFEVPEDLYRIEGIWDATQGTFLNAGVIAPGEPEASQSGNGWIDHPDRSVSFWKALGTSGGTLYYAATWEKPIEDDQEIEPPTFTHYGMALFASSVCCLPKANSAAKLGQYKTRIDSGNPEHNPILEMSSYFLKRFEIEMSRLPDMMKGVRT